MYSTRHALKFFALSSSALLLSGCVATLSKPSWLPKGFSDDQPHLSQLEPGKHSDGWKTQGVDTDVKQEQSAGLGLVVLPALEAQLNGELQTIKDTIGFPELPGKAYILASPTMNAMAKADGNIYIPIGMVMDIDSTDEMVALLAHELGHVLLNHTDTDLLTEIQKKGSTAWAVANQLSNDTAGAELSRRVRNTLTFSLAADRLLHPTWNRQQELAADKLAMDILVATGRDPNALIVLLHRLDRWEEINKSLEDDSKERTSLLVSAATAKFAKEGWQAAMMQALTPAGLAIEDAVDDMANTHMSTETRLEAANEYLRRHYRRVDRPAAETRRWRRVAHAPEVKRQAAAVKQAYTTYIQLLNGNTSAAARSLKRIPAREGRQQNYYRMLQAMVAEEGNKHAEVAGIAGAARELQYPSYRLLVMEERARQALAPAPQLDSVRTLYASFDTYGRPAHYYADLIQLAGQTGDLPFKYDVLLRCYAANFGQHAACDDASTTHAEADAASKQGSGVMGSLLGVFGGFK